MMCQSKTYDNLPTHLNKVGLYGQKCNAYKKMTDKQNCLKDHVCEPPGCGRNLVINYQAQSIKT